MTMAMHAAARSGHDGIVVSLIEAGADVQKKTDAGVTPLTLAAAHGQAKDQHEANRLRCRDEYFTNECEPDKRREYLEDDRNARISRRRYADMNVSFPFLSNFVRVSGWPLNWIYRGKSDLLG